MSDPETINSLIIDLVRQAMQEGASMVTHKDRDLKPAMAHLNERREAILALIEADKISGMV